MAGYMALYRKFRPITFDDVVGQEHIIKVLQHQIANNQVGHAYLFCGSRGTGKTTTAKIFSRAINCETPVNGEPCNVCSVCTGILEGSVPDVMEIDAASNNSVDDIRSIRENVIYAPTIAKYKVYIIDEVHMLSTSAFNALLKTLEEPPENVIFVLATTEPHKLPITILSRCQRFEFKRISKEDIAKRLNTVCEKNGVKADYNALLVVAQAADGALRDGLSLLDRIISAGVTEINENNARELLGIAESSVTAGVLRYVLNKDIANMLKLVNSVTESGKDIKYFVWEIITLARDVLIYKNTNDTSLLKNFTLVSDIDEISKSVDNRRLSEIISFLSELEANIKGATFPNILLESSLIELMSDSAERVENVKSSFNVSNTNVGTSSPIASNSTSNVQNTTPINSNISNNGTNSVETPKVQMSAGWKDVINNLRNAGKMQLYATLVSTKATITSDMVTVYFVQSFGKDLVEKTENMESLKKAVIAVCGKELPIKCVIEGKEEKVSSNAENALINLGVDVNIL